MGNQEKYEEIRNEMRQLNKDFKGYARQFRTERNAFDSEYKTAYPNKKPTKARFTKEPKGKGEKLSVKAIKEAVNTFMTRHKAYRNTYNALNTRLENLINKDNALLKNGKVVLEKTPPYLGIKSITLDNIEAHALEIEQKIKSSVDDVEFGEDKDLIDEADFSDDAIAEPRGEGASAEEGVAKDDGGLKVDDGKDAKDNVVIDVGITDPVATANTSGDQIGVDAGNNRAGAQVGSEMIIGADSNQEINDEFAKPRVPDGAGAGAQVVPTTSTDILTDDKGNPKYVIQANGGETQAENIDAEEGATASYLRGGKVEIDPQFLEPEGAVEPLTDEATTSHLRGGVMDITHHSRDDTTHEEKARHDVRFDDETNIIHNVMETIPEREDKIENELVSRESLEGDKLNVFTAEKALSSNALKLNMEQLKLGINTFHSLYDGVIPSFTTTEHQAGKKKALESKDIKTVREHFLKMEMLVKAYFSSLGGDLSVGVIISASDYFKSFGKEALGFGKEDNPVWNSREPQTYETQIKDDNMDLVDEVKRENPKVDDPDDPRKMNAGAGRQDDLFYTKQGETVGLKEETPRRLGASNSGINSRIKIGDIPTIENPRRRLRPDNEEHFTKDAKWSKHENEFISNLRGANPYNTRPVQRNILTRQGGVRHRYGEPIAGKEIKAYKPNRGMGYINDPTLHQDVRQPVYLPQPVVQRNPSQFVING